MKEYMLSTIDNPWDYFTQFREWLAFDMEKGYNCCGRLARSVELTHDVSPAINSERISDAIDTIIKYDLLSIYTKVEREVDESELIGDPIETG